MSKKKVVGLHNLGALLGRPTPAVLGEVKKPVSAERNISGKDEELVTSFK